MKFILLLFTSFLIVIQCYCQSIYSNTESLTLLFNSNSSKLTLPNKIILEKAILDIKKDSCNIVNVQLKGYTDSEGKDNYNLLLAKARIESVIEIISENSTFIIDSVFPFAKKGLRYSNKFENRRVEVDFICEKINSIIDSSFIPKSTIEIQNKTYEDSTIIFLSGMEAIIPKELVAIIDTTKLLSKFEIIDLSLNNGSGISGFTQDTEGNPLASAGMFDAIFKNISGQDTCLSIPITVRFPVRNDGCYEPQFMLPWKRKKDGNWEISNEFKIQKIKIREKEYFETKISCPGKFNMDTKLSRIKLKLKPIEVSGNYILDSVISTNQCKTIKLKGVSKNNKSIKFIFPCNFKNMDVEYYFHNKDNLDPYVSKKMKVSKHKKRMAFSFCRRQKKAASKYTIQLLWPKLKKRTVTIEENQLEIIKL